ncbi:MAG TPA: DUF1798 family protein [Bacillota bacterium]|nr:DUF1798 family protein [Bacillota bacterium]
MPIKEQTKVLQQYLRELRVRFEKRNPPESMSDQAFFQQMKEETEDIFNRLETWEEDALARVKNRELSIHPHQVASTRENMELLIMHSYYIDCRKRIYMEMYQSINYVFNLIIDESE